MQDTQETKGDPGASAPVRETAGLPFEFEDRSDGRHERALQEVRAAWKWIQSRRAHGLPPN